MLPDMRFHWAPQVSHIPIDNSLHMHAWTGPCQSKIATAGFSRATTLDHLQDSCKGPEDRKIL